MAAAVHAPNVDLQQAYHQMPPPALGKSLSDPDVPAGNNGFDNANCDLIMHVNDVLLGAEGSRYIIRSLLGQGTFGQVVECSHFSPSGDTDIVAVKVIKNQTAYFQQARVEIGVLQLLNGRADTHDSHHIVRMRSFFVYQEHLCLVFELLSVNLYELIKHNQFRGLSMNLLRLFMTQILDALAVLQGEGIIHCDLKPENVLLKGVETGDIKVIDFGSACLENQTVYSYIQSRFYRSPEVVLGHQYTMAIDMWSVGCVAAELFLGLPLFPGASEHDLLSRITEMLGPPPLSVLQGCSSSEKYFTIVDTLVQTPQGPLVQPKVRLRSREEFEAHNGVKAPTGKRYFKHRHLRDIIHEYPFRSGLSESELEGEKLLREALVDFLLGVLELDPDVRWTPRQALRHPFITGGPFNGPFQAPHDPRSTPQRRESFTTAKLAAHVAGASSYTQTPSCNTLIGPASMSGRAQMLAQSPEGAHAAAHAAAMASLAAGYSPTDNIARGWGGLSSGDASNYSMPLVPSYQQQQPLHMGVSQHYYHQLQQQQQQQAGGQQQQRRLSQQSAQLPYHFLSSPTAASHQQQQQQQPAGGLQQQYEFLGSSVTAPSSLVPMRGSSGDAYASAPHSSPPFKPQLGDDSGATSMMSRVPSGSFSQLAPSQMRPQWSTAARNGSSNNLAAAGVGSSGLPSLSHSLRKVSADLLPSSWLPGGGGGGTSGGALPSLRSHSIGGSGVSAAALQAARQQQQQQQAEQQQQNARQQAPVGDMSEELLFGGDEGPLTGDPFSMGRSSFDRVGSSGNLRRLSSNNLSGGMMGMLGSRSFLGHIAEDGAPGVTLEHSNSQVSWRLPGQNSYLSPSTSAPHQQQQQQQQQSFYDSSMLPQHLPFATEQQQQQQHQQQTRSQQQQPHMLQYPQCAASLTDPGPPALDVGLPTASALYQRQHRQQLQWGPGHGASLGLDGVVPGSSGLGNQGQVAAAMQRFSCS